MKTLMLFIALTASVWSSFSYSNETIQGYSVGSGRVSIVFCPDGVVPPGKTACIIGKHPSGSPFGSLPSGYVFRTIADIYNFAGTTVIYSDGRYGDVSYDTNYYAYDYSGSSCINCVRLSIVVSVGLPFDFQSCQSLEGAFIDGYHSSVSDFCANIGSSGGPNPQPLLCVATNISEIPSGSGNFQHTVTERTCSAPTGPDGGNGSDPGEPCTDNCAPETPPGGGNDGSDIPDTGDGPTGGNTTVGGNITDGQGNVTNINLTMDQDFNPITERINETNQRLKAENQNSSTIIDRLNDIIKGGTDNGKKLDAIKDAITDLGDGPDLGNIEGKLDGIKDGLDGIKDGLGTAEDGEGAADGVGLPDVEKAINDGYDAIMDAINSDANNELTDSLQTVGNGLTAFESIPQIFDMAAENCAPFSFGKINLNLCPYALTTSNVLTWVLTILTIIFIVTGVVSDIKRIRMT